MTGTVTSVTPSALSIHTRRSTVLPPASSRTGAVTLIQRFGSALNLNIHLHMLFLDGAYQFGGNKARFHRARRATG